MKFIQSITKRHFMRCIKYDVSKQIFLINKTLTEKLSAKKITRKDDDTPDQSEPDIIPVENCTV